MTERRISVFSRRQIFGSAVILAIGLANSSMAFATTTEQERAFSPPTQEVVLERQLTRYLSDSETIVVTRKWLVQFVPISRGYLLKGKQISSKVDAPPFLKPFARLEEGRVEEAIFPLALDNMGQIMELPGNGQNASNPSPQTVQAIEEARRILRQAEINPADDQTALVFLQGLTRGGGLELNRLPRDLFLPTKLTSEETVILPLPDGGSGSVSILHKATLEESGAIMRTSMREIITMLEENVSRSREEWTLSLDTQREQ